MKDNTVKLSGHAKDRFIERFFGEEADLAEDMRRRLVTRSQSAFTSLRVRKTELTRKPIGAKPSRRGKGNYSPPAKAEVDLPAAGETQFDPYAFGLVPVFQREGAEGLAAKLSGVSQIEQLRAMAKAQQIVLPHELRSGDTSVEAIRAGIVEAVGKRIKDRRAAAG